MFSTAFNPIRRLRRFVTFAVVGVLGTASHYLVLIFSVELAGIDPVPASFMGALTGAIINYMLNHAITFKSAVPHRCGLPKFLVIAASGLVLNMAIMALLFDVFGMHYLLCQILATGAVLVWNYLGSSLWAFRQSVARLPKMPLRSWPPPRFAASPSGLASCDDTI